MFFEEKIVRVVGAPFGDGQPLEGVEFAPAAFRNAGLKEVCEHLGWKYEDEGDIRREKTEESVDRDDTCNHELISKEEKEKEEKEKEEKEKEEKKSKKERKESNVCDSSFTSTAGLTESLQEKEEKEMEEEECIISRHKNSSQYYSLQEIKNSYIVGAACEAVCERVKIAAEDGGLVATLGGDHSIATGTISGMLSVYDNLRVIWVDAHGDCNIPESSPGGNYHGMTAAHIMGLFNKTARGFEWMEGLPKLPCDRIAYIGLRDLDEGEKQILKKNNILCFSMNRIDRLGIASVIEKALEHIDPEGCNPLHLSFDIDSCDPSITPATGTKARGGLTYREAHYICEALAETERLVSFDMVEISPPMDKLEEEEELHGDQLPIKKATTQTVRFALELIASLLGKTII